MLQTSYETRQTHTVIKRFAERHALGASAFRSDGRVNMTMDGRYRVVLNPAAHNCVALTSQLIVLPSNGKRSAIHQLLERLMKANAGLMQQHPSTLCLDERQQVLSLQQIVAADADVAMLETAIGEFVNALAFWSRLFAAPSSNLEDELILD
jgi:hypothetical protein